jgi:general secretion pathway protein I
VKALGFTLIEVLVALMIIALAMAALTGTVSSTARGSEYLRDKLVAQWIAMNRITAVRLKTAKFDANSDKGELDYANRHWRYDTRYFETENATIRRVVVRVWPAEAKEKSSPLAESASFLGTALSAAGAGGVDWWGAAGPAGPGSPGGTAEN